MATEPREVWGDLATSAFIGASLLFKTLDDATREDLMKLARVQGFAPGEVIVRQGDPSDDFFLVYDGVAAVSAERDGRAVDLGTLERGAYFGEFVVLGEQARTATVTARGELAVIRFPAPMIGALAERFPRVRKLLEALREARRKDSAEPAAG
jgi:CRP-like cAMP-binding protein